MAYVSLVFQGRVVFCREGNFDKVEIMGMATPAVGGMAARHQAASGGVALGVGSGARGAVVVRGVTVGAATT